MGPLRLAILPLLLVGCGAGSERPSCNAGFAGDPAAAPALEIVALGASMDVAPMSDGASAPLIFPPQGGRVIFAGARVTNFDRCGVMLSGALRDLATRQVRVDTRTVNLAVAGAFGESDRLDISTFANIPVCPNQWASSDIYGHEYELELTLTDRRGRSVTKSARVTPACAEPALLAECQCICKQGYVLGQPCS